MVIKNTISSVEWEELNKDLFERAVALINHLLKKTNTKLNTIDDLILIGEALSIPKIQSLIENIMNINYSSGVRQKKR
jgi:molecular chaperone DnaK (HSP70)